ncbi:MAG: thiosulfate oxidation carrier complex protein SoxZ [Gammaproteobacteria bacterium]|nr:thiosulfate oxidation carrier complex protein SoxZ [Gammaproteobacteria bacterium]MCW9056907.1 thiosulfate oxidation carrier complex protein SoxZ [Gammaproteobacteria bacterium]
MSTIKIRAKNKDGLTTVKALINHPMETGMRKDKKTSKMIPAHFIQEVSCTANGKKVLHANWGTAVSKNPYISFKLTGAGKGDQLVLSWKDNLGNSDSLTSVVK